MSDKKKSAILEDPLSEISRRERKFLLATSFVGIAVVKVGIVPQKISALGVEFEGTNQSAFLYLTSTLIVYFLVAFVIYAASDFILWRSNVLRFRAENIRKFYEFIENPKSFPGGNSPFQSEIDDASSRVYFWTKMAPHAAVIRAIFEFLLPVMFSAYAIYTLVDAAGT